jgi:hypothetical protein
VPPDDRAAVDDRSAIRAVAVTFAVNGIAFPSLLPRFPQIAEHVGASEAAFGLALAGAGVGGLLGGLAVPVVARRLGLVRTTVAAGAVLAAGVVCVGLVPTVPLLGAAFVLVGAADAGHDISMNEVALGEQARRPASVMGRLHGVWSMGSTAATAAGAGAAALRVPVVVHLLVVAAASLALQLRAAGRLRDRGDRPHAPAAPDVPPTPSLGGAAARPVVLRRWPVLGVLLLAAVGAVLAEGTGLDWSALALRRGLDAAPGVAGLGPLLFSAGILTGRAATDPLVDRLGAARVLVTGNLMAAGGMATGLVLAVGTTRSWPLLAGLALAGVGVAANFPMLFGAGDRVAERLRLPAGSGSSLVGTLPRLGGLLLPAAVGGVAEVAGVLPALGAVVLGAVLVAALLPPVVGRR